MGIRAIKWMAFLLNLTAVLGFLSLPISYIARNIILFYIGYLIIIYVLRQKNWQNKWASKFLGQALSISETVLIYYLIYITGWQESPFYLFLIPVGIYIIIKTGFKKSLLILTFLTIINIFLCYIHQGRAAFGIVDLIQQVSIWGVWLLSIAIKKSASEKKMRNSLVNQQIFSSITDISALLNDTRYFTESLIQHNPSAIIVIDTSKQIINYNLQAEKVFCCSPNNVVGKQYTDFFPLNNDVNRLLVRTLNELKTFDLNKVEYINLKGEKLYLLAHTFPIRNHFNELLGAAGIFMNVTEMVGLEEQIRLSDKLALVGQMAAGIAHELRNPLTPIRGFLQRFRDRIDKGLEFGDKQKQTIDLMINEIDRANDIIKEFLLMAKPAIDFPRAYDLNDLIDETAAIFESKALLEDIKVEKMLCRSIPLVKIDADQIKQVFLNLINNSIEAMERGGILKIITDYFPYEKMVVVSFSDTGKGIPEENLSKIFEPFFTDKSNGTGLGLTVSRQIVENHGGILEVSSKQGKGTTFVLKLPIWDGED